MSQPIHITPTPADYMAWMETFVPGLMLWYWDDSPIPGVEDAVRIIDRSHPVRDEVLGDIRYINAFHTWVMPSSVKRIIVDDGRWIAALSSDDRLRVNEFQVRFSRGLCIDRSRFPVDTTIPEQAIYEGRVVLDQHLWASLPDDVKRSILETEVPEWDDDDAWSVPAGTPDHIAGIANNFVNREGINCLAVTAFAITGDRADLEQWMMPDEFVGILQRSGYIPTDTLAPQPNDVLVWRGESIVHASFVVQSDRMLNKNGQASFNPITISDFAKLQAEWQVYTLEIHRHR